MSSLEFERWDHLETKYQQADMIQRLLDSAGQQVEIATYVHPETKKIVNVALQNVETGSVIIDFDLFSPVQ